MELHNKSLIIFEWFLVTITLVLLFLRLYVRLYLQRQMSRDPGKLIRWNDIFVALAWVLFLGQVIADTYAASLRYYMGFYKAPNDPEAIRNIGNLYKVALMLPLMYFSCLYCVKAAMLCYYTELVALTTYKGVWLTVMVSFGVIGTAYLNTVVSLLWGCDDSVVASNWSFDHETGVSTCGGSDALYFAPNIWHALTDVMVCSISFVLVRGVALARHQRIAVYTVFSLGLLSTVFAIANLTIALSDIFDDITKYYNIIRFLIVTEQFVSVSVACLPAFKKLVYRLLQKLKQRKRAQTSGSDEMRLQTQESGRTEWTNASADEEHGSSFKKYGYETAR